MLFEPFFWWSYEILSVITVVTGLLRWRVADKPTRLFIAILVLAFIVESAAWCWAKVYGSNLLIYHVFSPLELLSYCMYFQLILPQLKRWRVGWLLGGFGIVTAVLFEFIYPEDIHSNRFLMIESVSIICLCLYAFYCMMLHEDDLIPTHHVHFWLVASLTFFWCMSFLAFSFRNTSNAELYARNNILTYVILFGNLGMYIGVLLTLIYLPKLQSWAKTV